jgi:transcriptional antiterminator
MTDDVAVAEPADQANADVMNMLDHIAQANYEKANAIFNDQINDRLHNALEQEKVGIAQTITLDDLEATGEADETEEAEETPEAEAGEEAEIEDGAEDAVLDDEITDEDIEAAVDELIDDEEDEN